MAERLLPEEAGERRLAEFGSGLGVEPPAHLQRRRPLREGHFEGRRPCGAPGDPRPRAAAVAPLVLREHTSLSFPAILVILPSPLDVIDVSSSMVNG